MSEDIAAVIDRIAERSVVEISGAVLAGLVELNPVDTGHSSNNWIATINEPNEVVDGERKAPSHDMQDQGRQTVAEYKLSDGAVFITNCVPYVIYLVLGHSPQAAAGYDRFAVEQGLERGARAVADKGLAP